MIAKSYSKPSQFGFHRDYRRQPDVRKSALKRCVSVLRRETMNTDENPYQFVLVLVVDIAGGCALARVDERHQVGGGFRSFRPFLQHERAIAALSLEEDSSPE